MNGKKILIVDDEKTIRDSLGEAFSNAGFDDFFSKPFLLKELLEAALEGFNKIDRWMFI